ncbi:unnamed protein product, partial [Amoebophrya sp. A25]|eukprot:GSA25T00006528001.1
MTPTQRPPPSTKTRGCNSNRVYVRYFQRPTGYWNDEKFNMSKHQLLLKRLEKWTNATRCKSSSSTGAAEGSRNVSGSRPGISSTTSSSSCTTTSAPPPTRTEISSDNLELKLTCCNAIEVVLSPVPEADTLMRDQLLRWQTPEFLRRVREEYFEDPKKAIHEFEVPCSADVFRNEMRDVAATLAACEDALLGRGTSGCKSGGSHLQGDTRGVAFSPHSWKEPEGAASSSASDINKSTNGGASSSSSLKKGKDPSLPLVPSPPSFAFNIGGGSHHACPGWGEGYCVLNDVGISLQTLRSS